MLTLSQAFTDAFSAAEVEPVLRVELWTGTTNPQMFCTGGGIVGLSSYTNLAGGTVSESIKAFPSVAHVSPLATGLDPFERTIERNHLTVTFHDDGALRDFIVANRIIGKTVVVRLGVASMATGGDWAQVFRGTIDKVKPREGQIDLTCADGFEYLNRPYRGSWTNRHPLQAIKKVFEDCGTPSSLIDSASFDPANHTDISHYVVNYWSERIFKDEQKRDHIREAPAHNPATRCQALARAMVGSVFVQESGVVKFVRFDPAATVRANWGVDDVRDFEQLDTDIINEIEATTTTDFTNEGQGESVAVFAKDSTSQANHAGPGESARVFSRSVAFEIDDFQGRQVDPINDAGACSLVVAKCWGLPGTRVNAGYTTGSWGQNSDAALSASRPAYLMVEDEVLKAESLSFTSEQRVSAHEHNANGVSVGSPTTPLRATFTVASGGRGQMGTTATAHVDADANQTGAAVHDVTMAHDFAAVQLQRFSNGCPSVSVTTSLKEWAVQVGDFVTLDGIDVFLAHTFDGIGTSVKWEVTSKELRLDDNAAEILWTLVYATQTSPPTINQAFEWPERKPGKAGAARSAGHCYFVETGLEVTHVSGVVVSVGVGTAGLGATGAATSLHAARSLTMLSNKDSYIDYNVDGGSLSVISEANGAQEPELYAGNVRLAKVVTGASAVSSVVDLRRFARVTSGAIAADDFEAGGNLVHNPAFTSWACGGGFPPDLWEVGNTSTATWGTDIAQDSIQYYRGRYSVRIDGAGFGKRLKSKQFRVDPGRVYMLGGAVRAASASSTVKIAVTWLDSDGAQVGSLTYGVATTGFGTDWKEAHGAVTAHADAAQASVCVFYETTGASVWFDHIRMVRAWPNFHAEANAADSHASLSVLSVDFGSEKHDIGGNFANNQFTAPHDGFYKFAVNIQTVADATPVADLYGNQYRSVVRLVRGSGGNSTTIAEGIASDNGERWQFTVSIGSVELLAGDTVGVNLLNGTNRDLDIAYGAGQTWFMGEQTS